MPLGGFLAGKRFKLLATKFAAKDGIQSVHDLVLQMSSEIEDFGFITRLSKSAFENKTNFDDNVKYGILRVQSTVMATSKWSADRVGASMQEFRWSRDTRDKEAPPYFAGGMMFPFMLDACLELHQLKDVTKILSSFQDWPRLYNEKQLRNNKFPLYVATSVNDAYCTRNFERGWKLQAVCYEFDVP